MSLNLAWLDDFLALAESGNFSRAADERHITQPAFSRRIRALEDWLGVELFDRSSQPARLTEAGRWLRQTALDLQARVASLPGEAKAVAEASAATLSFAATHALSFSFVPRWLRALQERADAGPIGPVRLVSDVQQKCEELLSQHQVQFLVAHAHPEVSGPLDAAGCPSVVIGHDRLLPVSAPDGKGRPMHCLPHRGSTPIATLGYSPESGLGRILAARQGRLDGAGVGRAGGQADPIGTDRASTDRGRTDRASTDRAGTDLRAAPAMTAHLASVLRTMALDGQGLAWLPGLLVDEDIAAGRLLVAAPDEWIIGLEIRLYRDRAALAPAAEALWLAARMR